MDYAHTPTATTNRQVKALTLARLAWRYGVTADELDAMTPPVRRRFATLAEVNPPGPESDTWPDASARLARMWSLADSPDAPPHDLAGERPEWMRHTVAAVVPPEQAPPGWAERTAALPPLAGKTCLHCDQPAVLRTLDVYRCPGHPPVGQEWGSRLNWRRNPNATCLRGRNCLCGEHLPEPTPTPAEGPRR